MEEETTYYSNTTEEKIRLGLKDLYDCLRFRDQDLFLSLLADTIKSVPEIQEVQAVQQTLENYKELISCKRIEDSFSNPEALMMLRISLPALDNALWLIVQNEDSSEH
jgi:archaellum biogenesis ATPase FlaH